MIFTTQLGIVAFGIIFAVGGILYAINYDFTPITQPIYDFIGCMSHTNATWVGVCSQND